MVSISSGVLTHLVLVMGTSAADSLATSIASSQPPIGRNAYARWSSFVEARAVGRRSGERHFDEGTMFGAAEQGREKFQHRHLPAVLALQRLLRTLHERSIIDASPVSLRPSAAHLAARVTGGQADSIVRPKPFHLD